MGNTNYYDSVSRQELLRGIERKYTPGERSFLDLFYLEKTFARNTALKATGSSVFAGQTQSYVEADAHAELTRLFNSGNPEDKLKFFATLADSDYGISIDLNQQSLYVGDRRVSSGITRSAQQEKADKLLLRAVPALDNLKSQLLEYKRGEFSSISASNSLAFERMFSDVGKIAEIGLKRNSNSELFRSVTNLANRGLSLEQIKNQAIDETIGAIDFLRQSIRDNNGHINNINYDGGSGLYKLTIDGKTRIIDPDFAPLVHMSMPLVIETFGSESGNLVYDSAGSRVFHPGTWQVGNSRDVFDKIIEDPSYLGQIRGGSTQIRQGPADRTYNNNQGSSNTYRSRRYGRSNPGRAYGR